jgi:hypothetical protein
MGIAPLADVRDDCGVPRMEEQRLSKAQAKRLAAATARVERAESDYDEARHIWAELVRELGSSAVARELDLNPQAVSARLKVIESRSGRRYQ